MRLFAAAILAVVAGAASAQVPKLVHNHVGFEPDQTKIFLLEAPATKTAPGFEILDPAGKVVGKGTFTASQKVDHWHKGPFFRAEVSDLNREGSYRLRVALPDGTLEGQSFEVRKRLLPETLLSDILYFFKGQRSSGKVDRADSRMTFHGGRKGTVDVSGGWYDASGDVSKYLSHLNYTNYMCPQQAPLTTWALLECADRVTKGPEGALPALAPVFQEEALHGADWLVRMQDPEGYFYTTVFDIWTKDLSKRTIAAYKTQDGHKFADYQAAYREGGGMAIAALARAARLKEDGAFTSAQYLAAAEKGFAHLEQHNLTYCDNGRENLLDDYCALMAATELFATTGKSPYLVAARRRADRLMGRQVPDGPWRGHFKVDEGTRPYFHGAEAGLPVVALLRYRTLETEAARQAKVVETVKAYFQFELGLTREVANPFGIARQLVQDVGGKPRSAYFLPHKNESGYWWQGENARLASLATAANLAGPLIPELTSALRAHAQRQVDWILGCNPYDMCMLQGRGRNTPVYLPENPNAPGGVCNGITGGFDDESDLAYMPEPYAKDPAQNWRWSEQWSLHPTWLALALATQ